MIFAAKRERTADQHAHMAGAHTFYLSLHSPVCLLCFFCPRMQANSKTPQNKKPETIRIKVQVYQQLANTATTELTPEGRFGGCDKQ